MINVILIKLRSVIDLDLELLFKVIHVVNKLLLTSDTVAIQCFFYVIIEGFVLGIKLIDKVVINLICL